MPKRNRSKKQAPPSEPAVQDASRRGFLTRLFAIGVGATAALTPLIAGIVAAFSPLMRKAGAKEAWIQVARADQILAEGKPRPFPVRKERTDAWTKYPTDVVGTVLLRKDPGSGELQALSNVCPHLGCMVTPNASGTQIICPCHNSAFNNDGSIADPNNTVSPRDLDELPVREVDGMIEVQY